MSPGDGLPLVKIAGFDTLHPHQGAVVRPGELRGEGWQFCAHWVPNLRHFQFSTRWVLNWRSCTTQTEFDTQRVLNLRQPLGACLVKFPEVLVIGDRKSLAILMGELFCEVEASPQ